MRRLAALLFPFLFCLCLLARVCGSSPTIVTCTLDGAGGADFSDVQSALNGCRAPGLGLNQTVLISASPGRYPASGLTWPADVFNVTIAGVVGASSSVVLEGAEWFVDADYYYPSVNLRWLTLDMAGVNTSLFVPPLANNNVSMVGVNVTGFTGEYIIDQESCIDNSSFVFRDSSLWGVKGGSFRLQGMRDVILVNVTLGFSGLGVGNRAFMDLKPSWITNGIIQLVDVHHWTLWDCRQPRCRYAQSETQYDVRCVSTDGGLTQHLECFDRQATQAQGRCPIGDFVQYDEITNRTYVITNDYAFFCREWRECVCQQVLFRNTTTRQILSFPSGDIVFRNPPVPVSQGGQPPCDPDNGVPCQNGPTVATRYRCVPAPGVEAQNVTADMEFLGPTLPGFGDPASSIADAMTPVDGVYQYFYSGVIETNCSYPCPALNPEVLRNPDTTPCEWLIDAPESVWCYEGDAECCADYLIEGGAYSVAYKTNCSLSAATFDPAVVNGEIVRTGPNRDGALRVSGPFYDCETLTGCTAVAPVLYPNGTLQTPGGLTNCASVRCSLSDCRINGSAVYTTADPCWTRLNLGQSGVNFESRLLQSAVVVSLSSDATGTISAGSLASIELLGGLRFTLVDIASTGSTLAGPGFIANATLANGTTGAFIYVTAAGALESPPGTALPLASITYGEIYQPVAGSMALTYPSPACADASVPSSDPLCTFLRAGCADYYTGSYPAAGYSLSSIPPSCRVDVDGCAEGTSANSLCECSTTAPSNTFVPMSEVLGASVTPASAVNRCTTVTVNCTANPSLVVPLNCTGSNCTVQPEGGYSCTGAVVCAAQPACSALGCAGVCTYQSCDSYTLANDTRVPRFLQPRALDISALPCATRTFVQCDCPASPTETRLIAYCLPFPNVTDCEPVQLTRAQCIATPGCTPPPLPETDYGVTVNGKLLSCSLDTDELRCPCDRELAAQLYPPAPGSITIRLGNLPNTLLKGGTFQWSEVSTCGHATGVQLEQASYDVIAATTTRDPWWYFRLSSMYELKRQDSEFVTGVTANYAENALGTPYRRECNDDCAFEAPASFSRSEQDYECIIDSLADPVLPAYGNTLFSTWFEAVSAIKNGACQTNKTVLFRYNENPYNEPQVTPYVDTSDFDDPSDVVLVLDASFNDFVFASIDSALVLGQNWWIMSNVQNLTFVGLRFQYAGDGGSRLFNIVRRKSFRINRLTFLNCEFEGAGARAAGIIDSNRINYLDIRYSRIANWNYKGLRHLDGNVTRFEYNTVVGGRGRVVEVRFKAQILFGDNYFEDQRGVANSKNIPLVFLRGTRFARQPAACQGQDSVCNQLFGIGLFSLSEDTPACAPGAECYIRRNVLNNDVTDEDYRDTFITLSGSLMSLDNVTDNWCFKAQFCLSFIYVETITVTDAPRVMLLNPGLRPELYRSRSAPAGAGLRIAGYRFIQSGSSILFRVAAQLSCNFPCSPDVYEQLFARRNISCIVNNNYSPETMPYYGPWVPRYGYYQWHNVSDGTLMCKDFQVFAEDGRTISHIYITTTNGSRYYRDNITVAKDTYLLGDSRLIPAGAISRCLVPRYKPCVRGEDHAVITNRFIADDVCWELEGHSAGQNQWQTDPQEQLATNDVRLRRNDFDGRGLDLDGDVTALLMRVGTPASNSQSQRVSTNALPPRSSGYFEIVNCTCRNYYSFPTDPSVPGGAVGEEFLSDSSAPKANCFDVTFLNTVNTNTSAVAVGTYCENVDGECLSIKSAINLTATDNLCVNCTCRSDSNTAAYFFEGNPGYRASLGWAKSIGLGRATAYIDRNRFTQLRPCTHPTTSNRLNPVDVVAMYLVGFPDESLFCWRNNSANGTIPRDVRWSDMNQTIFESCLTYPNQLFTYDELRYLRALAREGNCNENSTLNPMNATVAQLEYSLVGTAREAHDEVLICNDCCKARDPTICYVDQGNGYFIQANDWYARNLLFNSTNECINKCNATTRECRVLGSRDVFGFWLSRGIASPPFKSYTEVFNTVVGPRVNVNQSTDTLVISGDEGMELLGCGHWLSNPLGIRVRVTGFTFRHPSGAAGAACDTWQFPANASTGHLTLEASVFNGAGTARAAVRGTALDGPFYLKRNLAANYTGSDVFLGVGRACGTGALFSATDNTVVGFRGTAISARGFDSIYIGRSRLSGGGLIAPPPGGIGGGVLNSYDLQPCADTPGIFVVKENDLFSTPGQSCAPPYTVGYFISPAQTQGVKSRWEVERNGADGQVCIGLQVDDLEPFVCDRSDPQYWLRLFYYPRMNNRIKARVRWLFHGPQTVAHYAFVDSDPDEPRAHRCHWCNEGCPQNNYVLLYQIVFGVFYFLALCCVCMFAFCAALCFCSPRRKRSEVVREVVEPGPYEGPQYNENGLFPSNAARRPVPTFAESTKSE